MVSLIRRPAQLKERWQNTLKKSFKRLPLVLKLLILFSFRGDWTLEEDLSILQFVKANGTKWARLSRILDFRNEHTIKNRFFGLVSKHTTTPTKKVKESKNYLNSILLDEVIKDRMSEVSETAMRLSNTLNFQGTQEILGMRQWCFETYFSCDI